MTNKDRLAIELLHKSENGIYAFSLSGNVDLDAAQGLNGLADACVMQGVNRIILDLAGIRELTAPGLGAFFEFSEKISAIGGRLIFVNVPSKVKKFFNLHDVMQHFTLISSFEKALKELSS